MWLDYVFIKTYKSGNKFLKNYIIISTEKLNKEKPWTPVIFPGIQASIGGSSRYLSALSSGWLM